MLCQLEDAGFCKKGEGGPIVTAGAIRMDAKLPVNMPAGLLSPAHVAGMNHIVEPVRRLRGAAANPVKDAAIGLVTGYGDAGDGAIAITRRAGSWRNTQNCARNRTRTRSHAGTD